MPVKVWIVLGVEFLAFALLLFLSAGTIMWSAGWAFLILFFGGPSGFARWPGLALHALAQLNLTLQARQPQFYFLDLKLIRLRIGAHHK